MSDAGQIVAQTHRVDSEAVLRRADLANELAYMLQADGQSTSVRRVHAAAEKKIDKAQSGPSVGELMRRRRWLKRCLRARRLIFEHGRASLVYTQTRVGATFGGLTSLFLETSRQATQLIPMAVLLPDGRLAGVRERLRPLDHSGNRAVPST